MTREEAIKSMSLKDAIQVFKDTNCYGTMDIAKSVILRALEQEPTKNDLAQERYQDLIEYFGDEKVARIILEDKKEFKAWLERLRWNVKRANELARELEQIKGTTKNDLGVDAILRAEVNQVIEDYMDEQYDVLSDRTRERAFGARAVMARINELPSVTPQEPRWIHVSERLPTKEEYIANNGLFIVSDGNRTYAEYFDVYNSMKYFGEPTMDGFRVDRCVTAWMPLPKAYREVVEE